MVDPTSDVGEDADTYECAACGSRVELGPDHRVVTWIDEGEVQTLHFCDEACRLEYAD